GGLDRHRDDRSAARGRHHAVDEGGGHGGGLQSARGESPHPGDPRPPRGGDSPRAHRGVHAVDAPALRGDPAPRERPPRRPEETRPRPHVRSGGAQEVPGQLAVVGALLRGASPPSAGRTPALGLFTSAARAFGAGGGGGGGGPPRGGAPPSRAPPPGPRGRRTRGPPPAPPP